MYATPLFPLFLKRMTSQDTNKEPAKSPLQRSIDKIMSLIPRMCKSADSVKIVGEIAQKSRLKPIERMHPPQSCTIEQQANKVIQRVADRVFEKNADTVLQCSDSNNSIVVVYDAKRRKLSTSAKPSTSTGRGYPWSERSDSAKILTRKQSKPSSAKICTHKKQTTTNTTCKIPPLLQEEDLEEELEGDELDEEELEDDEMEEELEVDELEEELEDNELDEEELENDELDEEELEDDEMYEELEGELEEEIEDEEEAYRILQDSVDQGIIKINDLMSPEERRSGKLYETLFKVMDFISRKNASDLSGQGTHHHASKTAGGKTKRSKTSGKKTKNVTFGNGKAERRKVPVRQVKKRTSLSEGKKKSSTAESRKKVKSMLKTKK